MASFGLREGLRGIITLFLVVLYLVNLKSNGVEAKKVEQIEDDLALERELKILKKPALKIITTKEGDILDCVDIYKQPAFDHPLLKDHKIQMKPTFFPKERANETSSAIEHVQISLKRKGCPEGTVPIRRTSKEDLLRARALSRDFSTINFSRSKKHFPGQLIVDVNYAESQLIHGASAEITLNNPIVNPSQYTNAQIWINGGPTENPNYIMAGWTVNPSLYGDQRTRLFTFWTGDGYRNGCYNTLCSGFVQVDRDTPPSAVLAPISIIGGHQYAIKIYIFQDRDTGNWWLSLGKGEAHIGYWPKSLFSYLADGADSVSWGGLAKADSNGVGPPMGSGLFSNNYYSSFFNRIEFVNGLYNLAYPPNRKSVRIREDSAKCYDLHFVDYSPTYGTNFRFGGPGGLDCTYLCSP